MIKTEDEIQLDFHEKFNRVKDTYKNTPEGMSGIGGYTPGPCHNGLISMTCSQLNKCVCHLNESDAIKYDNSNNSTTN